VLAKDLPKTVVGIGYVQLPCDHFRVQ
jgi:hypothetical protein